MNAITMKLRLVTGAACAIVCGLANAQTEIEEIVVTSQKREQAITDVPISISAVQEEAAEKANVTQFRYLENLSAKLSTSYNFAAQSSILSSRGISGLSGLDVVVAAYVDDVPFAIPGQPWAPNGAFFDLERIEIMNGPQGTLYGQGSMGGTVRVITNDPDASDFGGAVEAGYGAITDGESDWNVHGMINVPIVENVLAARVVYSKEELGGFLDFPNIGMGLDDGNDMDYEDVRAKLLFEPNDRLSVRFTAWENEANGLLIDYAEFPTPPGGDRRDSLSITGTDVAGFNSENGAWSLKGEYHFGAFTLTNTYSQLEAENILNSDFGGFLSLSAYDSESKSNEIRLVSNLDGPIQFVVGHYYYDGATDQQLRFSFGPFFLGTDSWTLNTEVSAFFGEVNLELFDGFVEIIAGVRRFDDDRDFRQFSDFPPIEGDATVLATEEAENFDSTNPRFNISLHPAENWMVYVNAAKGYRSGNFNAGVSQTAAASVGFPGDVSSIQPDDVFSIDIGTKFSALEGKLYGELAVFTADWDDAQQAVTFNPAVSPFIATLVNAGDLEIFGIEYAFTLRPTESLTLKLQGSYLDTEWKRLAPTLENFTILEEGGSGLGVPEHSVTASVDYQRPVTLGGRDLEFAAYADFIYQGKNSDAFGGTPLPKPSHHKFNTRFSIADPDSWEAALYVDNLTDEDQFIAISFGFIGTVPRPRTIGVSFKKYF